MVRSILGALDAEPLGPGAVPRARLADADAGVATRIAHRRRAARPGRPGSTLWPPGIYRTGILMATAQMITRWISASQPPPEAATWSSARFA